jgi:hypothetical protein
MELDVNGLYNISLLVRLSQTHILLPYVLLNLYNYPLHNHNVKNWVIYSEYTAHVFNLRKSILSHYPQLRNTKIYIKVQQNEDALNLKPQYMKCVL